MNIPCKKLALRRIYIKETDTRMFCYQLKSISMDRFLIKLISWDFFHIKMVPLELCTNELVFIDFTPLNCFPRILKRWSQFVNNFRQQARFLGFNTNKLYFEVFSVKEDSYDGFPIIWNKNLRLSKWLKKFPWASFGWNWLPWVSHWWIQLPLVLRRWNKFSQTFIDENQFHQFQII